MERKRERKTYGKKRKRTNGTPYAKRSKIAARRLLGLTIEKKYIDTSYADTVIMHDSWAGAEADPAANCLCAPVKGTGESDRIGKQIKITDIYVHGKVYRTVKQDQADAVGPTHVRLALVWDKQTNGTQLDAEKVYTDAGTRPFQFRDLDNIKRFQVLASKMFTLTDGTAFNDAAATGSLGGTSRMFFITKKVNIDVNFSANAGSVADIVDNSLHIICCTDGVGATDYLAYQARVRFVD